PAPRTSWTCSSTRSAPNSSTRVCARSRRQPPSPCGIRGRGSFKNGRRTRRRGTQNMANKFNLVGRGRAAPVAFAIAGLNAVTTTTWAQDAALIFVNGKVFTAVGDGALVQGFAVKGGRFIAVGSSDAMRRHAGASTRVIDLRGRLVTPGLSDGHF